MRLPLRLTSGLTTLLVLVVLLVPLTSRASANADDDQRDRLAAEAKALFAILLADDKPPRQTCEYSDRWEGDPIPEALARRYMGSTIHAALASPGVFVRPIDILGPDGIPATSFCDDERYKTDMTAKEAAFASGSAAELHIRRRSFSFPVFDRRYRTAMVVVSSEPDDAYRRNGVVPKREVEFFSYVYIYRKVGGRWRFVDSDLQSAT